LFCSLADVRNHGAAKKTYRSNEAAARTAGAPPKCAQRGVETEARAAKEARAATRDPRRQRHWRQAHYYSLPTAVRVHTRRGGASRQEGVGSWVEKPRTEQKGQGRQERGPQETAQEAPKRDSLQTSCPRLIGARNCQRQCGPVAVTSSRHRSPTRTASPAAPSNPRGPCRTSRATPR